MMTTILSTTDLNFPQKNPFLKHISFDLKSNTLTALVGLNGSGKTSLLRSLAGFFPEVAHTISLSGRELTKCSVLERSQTIAWLPQDIIIPFAYSVFDVIMMGRYPYHQGRPGQRDRDICEAWMGSLGLKDLRDRSILRISSGERRRVMIARLAVSEAPVLLLDEPLANLDPRMKHIVLKELRELADKGRCVLFSTHDLDPIGSYCDQLIGLEDGAISIHSLANMPVSELKAVYALMFETAPNWCHAP
jgi:iron complex transport system ATP-binding protein